MINRCLNKHRPNIKCGHFIWQWLWLILDTFSLQGSSMRVELWLAKILKTGCQWCVWFRLRFRETLLPPLVQRSPWHRGQSGAGPRRRGVMVVTVSRSLNCMHYGRHLHWIEGHRKNIFVSKNICYSFYDPLVAHSALLCSTMLPPP